MKIVFLNSIESAIEARLSPELTNMRNLLPREIVAEKIEAAIDFMPQKNALYDEYALSIAIKIMDGSKRVSTLFLEGALEIKVQEIIAALKQGARKEILARLFIQAQIAAVDLDSQHFWDSIMHMYKMFYYSYKM